jgi:hypothetical protein
MPHNPAYIDLDHLLLDVENPRHDVLSSQDETILRMAADQGDHLVNLAKDIVAHGLDPSASPIVMPDRSSGRLIVLEGNRRILSIKLLSDPSLAERVLTASQHDQLRRLATDFLKQPIVKVRCVQVDSRDEATHWIELRHTGPNKGVGLVTWDPESKERFKRRLGRSGYNKLALQIVEYLRASPSLDSATKASLDKVDLTNLARLANDPDVREALGVRAQDGTLATDLPQNEVSKGLKRVVRDLASDDFTVDEIKNKADRKKYIRSLARKDLPNLSKGTGTHLSLLPEGPPSASSSKARRRKALPLSTSRKTLIPSKLALQISHPRLNAMFHEGQGLEVERFPNCAAAILRVFLDLSVDAYAAGKHIAGLSPNSELRVKLTAVANYMKAQAVLTADLLKPVYLAAQSQHLPFSTNTLNAYMHNSNVNPRPSELKSTWDDMGPFVEKLWQ